MNFNPDFSAVSGFLRGVVTDLREKRLWPVAVLLVAALIAAPVLLSKSSSPTPTPVASAPVHLPSGNSIPALSVQTVPGHSRLTGPVRNPFGTASSTTSTSSSTSTPSTAVSTASTTASSVASNVGSTLGAGGVATSSSGAAPISGSTSTPSSGGSASNPASITPNAKPKPAPSGLTSKQAYDVALAMTDSAGGINTTDPLTRLSLLPSQQQPLLVELGVLQGGKRVVFSVQPGAAVNGPGTCIPGPLDCEILELGQDQTEQLSARTGSLGSTQVALFAVTGISATNYPSTAAADRARRAHSDAGQALVGQPTSSALSLFEYDPSLGAVVDLRNLTVGGS